MDKYIAAFNLMGLVPISDMSNFYKIPNVSANKFRVKIFDTYLMVQTQSTETKFRTDLLDTNNPDMKIILNTITAIINEVKNNKTNPLRTI